MKVKNYLLVEEIGSGSFSTVYKAVDSTDSSKVFAIKSMRDIPQNVCFDLFRKKRQLWGKFKYSLIFRRKTLRMLLTLLLISRRKTSGILCLSTVEKAILTTFSRSKADFLNHSAKMLPQVLLNLWFNFMRKESHIATWNFPIFLLMTNTTLKSLTLEWLKLKLTELWKLIVELHMQWHLKFLSDSLMTRNVTRGLLELWSISSYMVVCLLTVGKMVEVFSEWHQQCCTNSLISTHLSKYLNNASTS